LPNAIWFIEDLLQPSFTGSSNPNRI
jgi:hypothetical protein